MNKSTNPLTLFAVIASVIVLVIIGLAVNSAAKREAAQDRILKDTRSATVSPKSEGSPTSNTSPNPISAPNSQSSVNDFTGSVIAGKNSPYLDFNQADYDKALKSNKIILLNFYANWCPICRAEAPDIASGFNALPDDHVIGFRVNFNDDQTDDVEKKLANDFSIPYQHTKVILEDGKEVKRFSDAWDKETFAKEIEAVVGHSH